MKYIDINPEASQKFIDSLSVGEKQLYMDQLDARTNALSNDMLEKELKQHTKPHEKAESKL